MTSPSKILFISTSESLPWGGSEVLWVKVAESLLQMGHSVCFSYQYWPDNPAPLMALENIGAKGYYRGDPHERGLFKGFLRRYQRHLFKQQYPQFDVKHWMLSLVMATDPALVVINLCNAYQTADFYEPIRRLKCQKMPYYIVCQLEDDSQLLFPAKRERLREIYASACGVAFGSERGAEIVSRQLALSIPNVEIFDNPPNSSRTQLPWPKNASGELRMACVGRLDVGAKGQDRILAVVSKPPWRERSWRLSFYGEGPDEAYLRQLVAFYKLESRVRFAGYSSSVDGIWAQEHLCLQPSPKEGTPMTVVEAMFAGRPCVGSDQARMPDLIQEGVSGWIVPRSVVELELALEKAWEKQSKLSEMGCHAAEYIQSKWNVQYPYRLAEVLVHTARRSKTS